VGRILVRPKQYRRTKARPTTIMTWQEAMKDVTLRFEETGVSEACTNAEYLAAHVLGVWYKSELRKYLDEPLANEQVSQYEKLASRRLKH